MFSNKRNILFLFLIITFYILLGYFRDAVFVNINAQLYKLYLQYFNKTYEFELPNWLSFFNDWTYMHLIYFKYFLTALFSALYFGMCYFSIKIFYQNKNKLKWVWYSHGIIILIAILLYFGGMIIGNFAKGYNLTRTIMGLVQSPFITMLLIPAFKLEKL